MAVSTLVGGATVALDAMTALLERGNTNATARLVLYGGTPPADVTTALSSNAVLVTFPMADPAFAAAVDAGPHATATAGTIPGPVTPSADGTYTFWRLMDKDEVAVIQGDTTDLVLTSTTISTTLPVSITSFVLTHREI